MKVTIDSTVVAKDVYCAQIGYSDDKLLLEMENLESAKQLEADLTRNKISFTKQYLNRRMAYFLDYKSIKIHKNHKDYVCNAIVTKPVKTSWTKEEITEFICNKFDTYYMNYVTIHNRCPLHCEIEKWLEKNLE